MNSDITFVYLIIDELDENIFLKNKFKSNENTVVSSPKNYNLKYVNNIKSIKVDSFYSSLFISRIFEQVDTEWIIILKPEEAFPSRFNSKNLKPGIYILSVEKCINQNKNNNLIYGDIKLYHRNYEISSQIKFNNQSVINYNSYFPEMEKFKTQFLINQYKIGIRDLKTILYLIDKRVINIDYIELYKNYYNENDDSTEMLELSRYLIKSFIINKDLNKAKEIIFQSLLNFPSSPCINSLLSEVYFMEKDYEQASFFISKCISMGKDNSYYMWLPFNPAIIGYAAYYFLGKIYYEMNKLTESKLAYEDCIELKPDFLPAINDHKNLIKEIAESESYVNELDFACQGCGNCCRNFSRVNINHRDIARIIKNQDKHKLNVDQFVEFYHDHNLKISLFNLKKKENSKDCIFLEDNKCTIHEFKPHGCKIWPFALKKNENVTWSNNNREFIKKYCAFTEIKGANDKETLLQDLKINDIETVELKNIVYHWQEKINIDKKLNPDFIKYLADNYS